MEAALIYILENDHPPQNDFEKLPKNILFLIFASLPLNELTKIFRLNKFFYKQVSSSQSSLCKHSFH